VNNILCGLCPFFLGSGLAVLLFWLSNREPVPKKSSDAATELPFGILWFSQACRSALGDRCSRPGRLRKMRKECIARFLKDATFLPGEAPPEETQYATWPMQADLICQGKFESLREWQRAEMSKGPNAAEGAERSFHDGRTQWSRTDTYSLIAIGGLLLAALLSFYLAKTHDWCGTYVPPITCPPPPPPPTVHELRLSSDVLFGFNEPTIRGDAHRAYAVKLLKDAFKDFAKVEFTGVSAHTDPIGSLEENRRLANQRAQDVRGLLQVVINDPERPKSLADQKIDETLITADEGAVTEDRSIWRACWGKYYLGNESPIPKLDKPLLDLPPALLTAHQLSCSKASIDTGTTDPYPGCARLDHAIGNAQHTYEVGERFRQIVECLAPMRHVLIRFRALEYQPEPVKPDSTTTPKG
jgi:outer membrane protein OmpA-like peptidoglycan-associated protein